VTEVRGATVQVFRWVGVFVSPAPGRANHLLWVMSAYLPLHLIPCRCAGFSTMQGAVGICLPSFAPDRSEVSSTPPPPSYSQQSFSLPCRCAGFSTVQGAVGICLPSFAPDHSEVFSDNPPPPSHSQHTCCLHSLSQVCWVQHSARGSGYLPTILCP
jgi:hypothetical protein